MLGHEPEKFPLGMKQGPKVVIPLRPPSSRHWNIDSDLAFTIAVDTHRRQHEAKTHSRSLRGLRSLPDRHLLPRGLLRP